MQNTGVQKLLLDLDRFLNTKGCSKSSVLCSAAAADTERQVPHPSVEQHPQAQQLIE
jgi:hypothetical protein